VVEPWEEFSVARYVELADAAIADIRGRGKPIFVCGGTALYLKALTDGLFEGPGADAAIRERLHATAAERGSPMLHDELRRVDVRAAERIHPNDLKRIVRALEIFELTGKPISELQVQWDRGGKRGDVLILGLRRPIEEQNRRTNQRVHRMIEAGLVDEVRALLAEPRPLSSTARQALGYAEMIRCLSGELSLDQAVEAIKINTRQFAKSQRTWFRRIRTVEWIEMGPDAGASRIADQWLERRGPSCFKSPN
jgi:tRNA dimethylallyltransferase